MSYTIKRGDNVDFLATFDSDTALVTDITSAVLSVSNNGTITDHDLDELTVYQLDNSIGYEFTQEETLAFAPSTKVKIELAVLMNDKRQCCVSIEAFVKDVLYDEVLE